MALDDKMTSWTRVDKHGRIVIPAQIREAVGLPPGTKVRLWVEDGELRLMSLDASIKRVQAMVAKYTKGRTGLVDEFIAERRREAERE
jgi:AbrB family looped-hinge helix DNA binding protein